MSYLYLARERTRERTPEYDSRYRPLVRRDTNRQRTITVSDDEDDYPYTRNQKPTSSSRALAVREPSSQLERYNIWSDRRSKEFNEEDDKWVYERKMTNKCTPSRPYRSDLDEESKREAEEREYKLNLQASFSRPKFSSSSSFWPLSYFRSTKEKWQEEDWETVEHSRSKEYQPKPIFWEIEEEKDEEERWARSRRLKRTKTEEFTRPLSGWRRERIVYGY